MPDIIYHKDNVKIEITSFKENKIFTIQITSYEDTYDKNPKCQEVIIDTENECVMTGNICKILLNMVEKEKK